MNERLTKEDWLKFALAELSSDGHECLKADTLARRMGVTRGSFYWHFADLADFHAQVIELWKHRATESVIDDLEVKRDPVNRLATLLHIAFSRHYGLESRMRAWGDRNPQARQASSAIDDRRVAYMRDLLAGAGIDAQVADTRSRVIYWAYLGSNWSGREIGSDRVDGVVAELVAFAFMGSPQARG